MKKTKYKLNPLIKDSIKYQLDDDLTINDIDIMIWQSYIILFILIFTSIHAIFSISMMIYNIAVVIISIIMAILVIITLFATRNHIKKLKRVRSKLNDDK